MEMIMIFELIKFITLLLIFLIPNNSSYQNIKNELLLVRFNIIETFIFDTNYFNMFCGVVLCIMLSEKQSSTMFKLWTILYLIWNVRFCINVEYSFISALSHNLPCAISVLRWRGSNFKELWNLWCSYRASSLLTAIIPRIYDHFIQSSFN